MTCWRGRIVILAMGLSGLISSFGFADQGANLTSLPEVIPADVVYALSPAQKRRAMQMTTYFENSTIQFQYSYIEDIHDGRGLTAGRIGFCTGTGDLNSLVILYCQHNQSKALCQYRDVLAKLARESSGDTTALGPAFVRAWKQAALDPVFRHDQDEATDHWYYEPAMQKALHEGLRSALGKAIFYDTIVQHGEDGLQTLIDRTNQAIGPRSSQTEVIWLTKFLEVRRAELLHPTDDPESQAVWADSVGRADFFKSLLVAKNLELRGPIEMDPQEKNASSIVP